MDQAMLLNVPMDEIAEVSKHSVEARRPRGQRERLASINPFDHYEIEAHGVTLDVSEDRNKISSVFSDVSCTEKAVIHVLGKRRIPVLSSKFSSGFGIQLKEALIKKALKGVA